MFRTMGRRAIASTVGFFMGWIVFQIVTPVKTLPAFEPPGVEILSITLRHQGCADSELKCAIYDLTFYKDGTATYTGHANDEFIGEHTGYIDALDFNLLTDQLYKQRFFELPQHYATAPTEEIIVLEVVTSEGLRRVVTNNWFSTPVELRALHVLIAEQVYHMQWEEAE